MCQKPLCGTNPCGRQIPANPSFALVATDLGRVRRCTMNAARWTEADIADQSGRTALVTGANSGIGFEAARALAQHGARVLLGCRDAHKADGALARIREVAPDADVSILPLDLADLSSIRNAAGRVAADEGRLDLLINNAGVMALPKYETADGFELQFGTNHLGHFALTGLLLDILNATPGARVVSVSSQGHRMGRINFDDLQGEASYSGSRAYNQSKLSNVMFTYELARRLGEAELPPTRCIPASCTRRSEPRTRVESSDCPASGCCSGS